MHEITLTKLVVFIRTSSTHYTWYFKPLQPVHMYSIRSTQKRLFMKRHRSASSRKFIQVDLNKFREVKSYVYVGGWGHRVCGGNITVGFEMITFKL